MRTLKILFRTHPFLILFNLAYVLGFGGYYAFSQNYEFLWYVLVLVFFLVLIGVTLEKSRFTPVILWMLSLWGLLHMAGGGVVVNGDVLYTLVLVPLAHVGDTVILKYDQVVHFYGFFVSTWVMYHLLAPHLKEKAGTFMPFFVSSLAGAGLGALNEIVEFAAVVSVPETGVGGYYNTALDLVFNMFGALAAAWVLFIRKKRECPPETSTQNKVS